MVHGITKQKPIVDSQRINTQDTNMEITNSQKQEERKRKNGNTNRMQLRSCISKP